MNQDAPSLHTVVDVLTARAEYAERMGLLAEERAMRQAREIVTDYILRDVRQQSWIRMILDRIRLRPVA